MNDNSDLLGADSSAAVPPTAPEADKPKRGRPRKAVPAAAVPASTENPETPEPVSPEQQAADLGLSDLLSDDGLAAQGAQASLPPVSPEYARAMAERDANRISIIGQPRREYAWQRLKRAGKKI